MPLETDRRHKSRRARSKQEATKGTVTVRSRQKVELAALGDLNKIVPLVGDEQLNVSLTVALSELSS